MDISLVQPGLYIGSLDQRIIAQNPNAHILFLAEGDEDTKVDQTTRQRAMSSGRLFLQVKGREEEVNILSILDYTYEFIAHGLHNEKKVFVLTQRGYSLAGAIVCGYLIKRQGLTLKDAIQQIRLTRAIAIPSAYGSRQLASYRKAGGNCNTAVNDMQNALAAQYAFLFYLSFSFSLSLLTHTVIAIT